MSKVLLATEQRDQESSMDDVLKIPDVPKISVVIPTRNRAVLLERAINSALQQTVREIEVIVVRDGQDAETRNAIDCIGDERLRFIALEDSVGGSEARNIGVRAARGRYIALLDDDDEWLPTKLERQIGLAELASGKRYVVVTSYLYRIHGQTDEVWPGHLPTAAEPLSEFLFSSKGGFQTSTYLCLRELMLSVPFTPGLKKHQDWDWFLRLAAEPEFQLLTVDEPLSIYWVPQPGRKSVSTTRDWKFSYEWANDRLPWMTRRAYARFLVKICARQAAEQRAGLQAFCRLAHDLLIVGRCSPALFAEFLVSILLPESARMWLRRVVHASRGSTQQMCIQSDAHKALAPTMIYSEEGANACPR